MTDDDRFTSSSAESFLVKPECAAHSCSDPTRRKVILAALATGAGLAAVSKRSGCRMTISPERTRDRRKPIFSLSPKANMPAKSSSRMISRLGGPPVRAWPKDPKTSVVRDGSRLNEILVIKLDPAELDDETRARSAEGIVAYSVICAHAGCPITGWVKGASGDKDVLKCFCHNSEFNPRKARRSCSGRHAASRCIAADDIRRLARRRSSVCRKGRCSASRVTVASSHWTSTRPQELTKKNHIGE